jgi:hypothetical protein
MRKRLVLAAIAALRDSKIDVRSFKVGQVQQFVELVAQYAPQELEVFYKYIDSAASSGMFADQFEPLAKLFCLFVD